MEEANTPQAQVQETPAPSAPAVTPELNAVEWDKQKKELNKKFYKTFSPRLFGNAFSYIIDVARAKKGATAKGLTIPEGGMVLTDEAMFFGSLMIEVTGDSAGLVELGKVYTKLSTGKKSDLTELEVELGAKPSAVYSWKASPTQSVLVAVEGTAVPAAPTVAPAPEAAANPAPTDTPASMPSPADIPSSPEVPNPQTPQPVTFAPKPTPPEAPAPEAPAPEAPTEVAEAPQTPPTAPAPETPEAPKPEAPTDQQPPAQV